MSTNPPSLIDVLKDIWNKEHFSGFDVPVLSAYFLALLLLGIFLYFFLRLFLRRFPKALQRLKYALIALTLLCGLLPWYESAYLNVHFKYYCDEMSGLKVFKKAHVEGYLDGYRSSSLRNGLGPKTAYANRPAPFEEDGFRFIEYYQYQSDPQASKIIHVERDDKGVLVASLREQPEARYLADTMGKKRRYDWRILLYTETIIDMQTGEVMAQYQDFVRFPPLATYIWLRLFGPTGTACNSVGKDLRQDADKLIPYTLQPASLLQQRGDTDESSLKHP